MARSVAGRVLDQAVRDHRITLVYGLPRVGRTQLVAQWCAERGDVEVLHQRSLQTGTAPVRVLDHFSLYDVVAFVEMYRALEQAGENVRFVLVPVDLLTSQRVQEALVGNVNLITIDPLQPDEFAAEHLETFVSAGPTGEAIATARLTNSAPPHPDLHWLRGGLPESLSADTDEASVAWRRQLISSLLIRDYSSWGITPATKLSEILRWVANLNGCELDENNCPIAKRVELLSTLHVFDRLGLTRRLPNFPAGTVAGLGKKPKLFIRDTGVLHAMLGIETVAQLRTHPAIGDCFESYAIEGLISAAAGRCTAQFYREKLSGEEGADEIDLVLDFRPFRDRLIAIECKTSPDKAAKAGFHRGCATIGATDGFVVHAGPNTLLGNGTDRLNLAAAIQRVGAIARLKL